PGIHHCDGFFFARFRKLEGSRKQEKKQNAADAPSKAGTGKTFAAGGEEIGWESCSAGGEDSKGETFEADGEETGRESCSSGGEKSDRDTCSAGGETRVGRI
ncbi:MAG: hypothetical protein ACI4EB_02130, partial [Bilifractor sp.]